ncbi:STAS domain-containing protein [Mycobacterium hodleri]|uniref:Anti-sigma factor antagonist n=1 Tax=Mycolicibacterium hodleri TaxID=49897 RepID=A0A544VQY1_9MYCO|nr:STAS domain-containing protein [Mycolicibacterium hodleri]
MGVAHRRVDRLVVITVTGEVDAVTAPHLSAAIDEATAGSSAGVIVDLSDVHFLASAGLGVLITTHDQMAPSARFGVVADGPATRRPITVLGLDDIITLYRTLEDAVADMGDA